jgi:pimeloyl-ACP methyl ester carboxylesterase
MNRRATITALAAGASGGLACASNAAPSRRTRGRLARSTYVLVHGAWHGGWCWREVRALLEQAGHRVFTPTLTGLGERAHLRTPVPTLATHIQDVMSVIEAEELNEVILVGHSYAGMVITGVADKMKSRIKHIIYLDAALPQSGQSMITQNPAAATPEAIASTVAGLKSLTTDGEWMTPLPALAFGIPAEQTDRIAWLGRRLTAHPLTTWTDVLTLANGGSDGLARTYIFCTKPVLAQTSLATQAARIRAGGAGAGWLVIELQAGHDAMVSAPDGVASLLMQIN